MMKYMAKVRSDLDKIHDKFGDGEFSWKDIKNMVSESAQFYKYAGIFEVVRKEKNSNVYKIKRDLLNGYKDYPYLTKKRRRT